MDYKANYNEADLRYYNERKDYAVGRYTGDYKFKAENEMSLDEKADFVDSFNNGKLTKIAKLAIQYDKDFADGVIKSRMDYLGNKMYNINSLAAWLKKNDTDNAVSHDTDIIGRTYINNVPVYLHNYTKKAPDIINAAFHNLLHKLADNERVYFCEHDEYEIAKQRLRDSNIAPMLVDLITSSDGTIKLSSPDDEWGKNRKKITLDEINEILTAADKVAEYIKTVRASLSMNKN